MFLCVCMRVYSVYIGKKNHVCVCVHQVKKKNVTFTYVFIKTNDLGDDGKTGYDDDGNHHPRNVIIHSFDRGP